MKKSHTEKKDSDLAKRRVRLIEKLVLRNFSGGAAGPLSAICIPADPVDPRILSGVVGLK